MNSVKAIVLVGLMSFCPLLAWGAVPAFLVPVASTNDIGAWIGDGAAFDADLNLVERYELEVVNRQISETQILSRITATPENGEPVVTICLFTGAGPERTVRCNTGNGEQVVLGSLRQTSFHLNDGSTLESTLALDDGGERLRVIRRHFNSEGVIGHNRESLQKVQ